jgi:hypothetical protein
VEVRIAGTSTIWLPAVTLLPFHVPTSSGRAAEGELDKETVRETDAR